MATHAAPATPWSSAARRYGSGAGFDCSVSPDETMNVKASSSAAQHQFDLGAQCTRRNTQRPGRAEPPHHRGRAGIEDASARHELLKPARLRLDQHLDLFIAEQEVVVFGNFLKHTDIVVPQIAGLVGGPVDVNALRLEQLLVHAKMQRFGVCEHSVEVEHDGGYLHRVSVHGPRLITKTTQITKTTKSPCPSL
jgi:hypothetical protein